MILTSKHIKNEIELIKGYNLVLYKYNQEFEVKITDTFTGEYLIIDNDFILILEKADIIAGQYVKNLK